jgi:hypothetical protein
MPFARETLVDKHGFGSRVPALHSPAACMSLGLATTALRRWFVSAGALAAGDSALFGRALAAGQIEGGVDQRYM